MKHTEHTPPPSTPKMLAYWLAGIRLYIAIGIFMLSAETWWWAHAAYSGNITYIRLQEAYAWIAIVLLSLALLIGPVCKLLGNVMPSKAIFYDARRLLGIGAAWFATLHVAVVYTAQFNLVSPLSLPSLLPGNFKIAFMLGASALLILLAMALTSFDKALKGMGIWWFRLHRLVYAAALLAMLHAFMVGVHATLLLPLVMILFVALVLITLHGYVALRHQGKQSRWRLVTLGIAVLLLLAIANYGTQQYFTQSSGVLGGLQGMDMHH